MVMLCSPSEVTDECRSGQLEKVTRERRNSFDANNPLCPGGRRFDGSLTPSYTSTYTFDNDFPALLPHVSVESKNDEDDADSLFRRQAVRGLCRVMCFHPNSRLQLATMEVVDIVAVIKGASFFSCQIQPAFCSMARGACQLIEALCMGSNLRKQGCVCRM